MLAMLVVATAFAASNEDQFDSEHISKIFSENDMTPDFTEQLGSHDHMRDIKKRNDGTQEKYGPLPNEVRTTIKHPIDSPAKKITSRHAPEAPGRHAPTQNVPEDGEKRPRNHNTAHEEIDVVDREDHVSQYLSDQLVNTDSEITSIQASDSEDEHGDSQE